MEMKTYVQQERIEKTVKIKQSKRSEGRKEGKKGNIKVIPIVKKKEKEKEKRGKWKK